MSEKRDKHKFVVACSDASAIRLAEEWFLCKACQQVSMNFGLTVCIPKTKHMVTGRFIEGGDPLSTYHDMH